MACDSEGRMRECRPDCAWAAHEPGAVTCAATSVATALRNAVVLLRLSRREESR